jgi:adenosine deaminase
VGGILSIGDQIDVGRAIWDEMGEEERNDAINGVGELLALAKQANKSRTVWPKNWSQDFLSRDLGSEIRSMRAAALLTQIPAEQLRSLLFPSIEDRWLGRVQMRIDGFDEYPLPGELMGSTLLASKSSEALRRYCRGITEYCKSDNIRYIEVRLSPTKYRHSLDDQVQFVLSFSKLLNSSMKNKNYEYMYGLIISGDRRHFSDDIEGRSRFDDFLTLLSKLSGDKISREIVLGFDIAGAEEEFDLPEFVSAGCRKIQRETNLQFTLHSGEQSSVENLHQALDSQPSRIGHGLKFEDDPKLMENCARRGVALEMCPSSNIEVHGFSHPELFGMLPTYPLREYLDAGLRVCICTDNPFISRTDSTNEYIMASLMIGGIHLGELLGLVWDSFDCSFLPRVRKISLQTSVDEEIRGILEKEFGTN